MSLDLHTVSGQDGRAGTFQHGIGVPETRRTTAAKRFFYTHRMGASVSMASKFWAAVWGIFGCAGSLFRYANPHSSPSPIGVGVGGFSTANKETSHV